MIRVFLLAFLLLAGPAHALSPAVREAALAKPAFDTDAQAFISAVEQFETLSDKRKAAINNAVMRLKTAGYWDSIPFFAGLPLGTEGAFALNLMDPSQSMTKNGSPSFTPYDGSDANNTANYYWATPFNPSTYGLSNNCFIALYESESSADNANIAGNNSLKINPWQAANTAFLPYVATTTATVAISHTVSSGFSVALRPTNNSGDVYAYQDGVLIGNDTVAVTGHTNAVLHFLKLNGDTATTPNRSSMIMVGQNFATTDMAPLYQIVYDLRRGLTQ